MSDINTQINWWINLFLVLIPVGAAIRIIYCCTVMMNSEDEVGTMKKRIRNVLVYSAIAFSAAEIIKLVVGYFPKL